jgi:hypothetical protein
MGDCCHCLLLTGSRGGALINAYFLGGRDLEPHESCLGQALQTLITVFKVEALKERVYMLSFNTSVTVTDNAAECS